MYEEKVVEFKRRVGNKVGKFYGWDVEYDCELMFVEEEIENVFSWFVLRNSVVEILNNNIIIYGCVIILFIYYLLNIRTFEYK